MNILIINCGSSSVKFKLFDMNNERIIIQGICDAISLNNSSLNYKFKGKEYKNKIHLKDHNHALKVIVNLLKKYDLLNCIDAIGHRVVHGGEYFIRPTIINEGVLKKLKEISYLAPLHNPVNILGIEVIMKLINKPNVAVFDTSFHSTLPKEAFLYAIPYEFYKKYKIRRYGFHGMSHKYVSIECAKILNKDIKKLRIITCHLGNGASITAIKHGRSIETSMGFTPLEGLVMGTRCGDIDPYIPIFLQEKESKTSKEIYDLLNKESGLKGLSELSSDMRILLSNMDKEKVKLAIDVFIHRIVKYIGAYISFLNGLDALVFTAGIGENNPYIRKKIIEHFSFLNIKIDEEKNKNNEVIISSQDSKVKVLVIKTNEELQIAREVMSVFR